MRAARALRARASPAAPPQKKRGFWSRVFGRDRDPEPPPDQQPPKKKGG